MGNPQVTCCDLAWLGAMVDAEGSIGIYKTTPARTSYWGCIDFTNTDAAILGKYTGLLQRLNVPFHLCTRQPRNTGTVPCTDVRVGRANALLNLLTAIEPYLVGKRLKARLLRKWIGAKLTEALARSGPDRRGRARRGLIKRGATEHDHLVYDVMRALQKPGNLNEHTWASEQAEKMCSDL